jgi:hypothetical protein
MPYSELNIVYSPLSIRVCEEITLESLEEDRRRYQTYLDRRYCKNPCRAWGIIQDWLALEVFLIIGYDNDNDLVTLMEWPYRVDEDEIKRRHEEIINEKYRVTKVVPLKNIQDYMVLLHW